MPDNFMNPWQDWQIDPTPIGKGSFGQIYRITRDDEFGVFEEAAMKVLNIPTDENKVEEMRSEGMDDASITTEFHDQVRDIVNEYKLMKELRSCNNIVHCDDYKFIRFADGLRYKIFIRMELLTPLTKIYSQATTDREVIRLGIGLCNALEVCRRRGILHRDIKPQNIFRDNGGVYKLGDFGIARVVQSDGSVTSNIGTYNYMAPEVHSHMHYGHTADIYSLGLVMHFLLNDLRQPFLPPAPITYTDQETARQRRFRGDPIPKPKNGSEALKKVILKACAFDPLERYQTAKELSDALVAIEEGTVVEPVKIDWNRTTDDLGKKLSPIARQRRIALTLMLRNIAQYRTDRMEYTEAVEDEAWSIYLGKYPVIDSKALEKWRAAGLQRLTDMADQKEADSDSTQYGYKMVHMSDPKLGTVSGYVKDGPVKKNYDTFIPGYAFLTDPFYLENKSRHQIWQDSQGSPYRGSETLVCIQEAVMLRKIAERKESCLYFDKEAELEALKIYLDYDKPIGNKPVFLWEDQEVIRNRLKLWRLSGYREIELLMSSGKLPQDKPLFSFTGEETVDPVKARQEQEKRRKILELPTTGSGYDYTGEHWDPLADDNDPPKKDDPVIFRKDADGNFYAGTAGDLLWMEAIMYRNILDAKVNRLLYTPEVAQEFQQFKAGIRKFSNAEAVKWIEDGKRALEDDRVLVDPDGKVTILPEWPEVLSDRGWEDEDGKVHFGLPPKDWIPTGNGRWRAPGVDITSDSQITRKDANGRAYTGTEAEITVLEAIMYRQIAQNKVSRMFYSEAVEQEFKLYRSGARKITLEDLAKWTDAGKKKLEENKKWFPEADSDPFWMDADGKKHQGFPPQDWVLMENGRWRAPGTVVAVEPKVTADPAWTDESGKTHIGYPPEGWVQMKNGRWKAPESKKPEKPEPQYTRRDDTGNRYTGTQYELNVIEAIMYRNIAQGKTDRLLYTQDVQKELERMLRGEVKVSTSEFDRWLTDGKNALKKIEEAKKAPVISRKDSEGREYSGTEKDIALIEAIMYRNISDGKATKLLFTADVQNEFKSYKSGKTAPSQSDISKWTLDGKNALRMIETGRTHVDPVRNPFLRFLQKLGNLLLTILVLPFAVISVLFFKDKKLNWLGKLVILGLLIWGIVSFVTGKDKTEVQGKKPDAPSVIQAVATTAAPAKAETVSETTECDHVYEPEFAVGKGNLLGICSKCADQKFLKAETALVDLPRLSDSNPAGTNKDVDRGTFTTSDGSHWGKAMKFWVINKEGYTNSEYIEFDLNAEYTTLVIYAACGKDSQDGGFMDVSVTGDGTAIGTVRNISKIFEQQAILDVTGVKTLRLECSTESSVNCHCVVQAYLGNFEK